MSVCGIIPILYMSASVKCNLLKIGLMISEKKITVLCFCFCFNVQNRYFPFKEIVPNPQLLYLPPLGGEQPIPLWNEHEGTTDGDKPKILLYSLNLQFKVIYKK